MTQENRLNKLIKPKTKEESSYKVYASATYYDEYVKVYIPNAPYWKLKDGYEAIQPVTSGASNGDALETNIERSIRRTVKNVKDYTLCNNFDLFVTFTFAEDRQDINKCKKKMHNWLNSQKKRVGKFDYLIVPEFHKDGKSLHFHAVMRGYKGELLEGVNVETGKPITRKGLKVYSLKSYRSGFSDARKIDESSKSRSNVARYVSKYITKDMPLFAGKKRYWSSQGLKLPVIRDNPPKSVLDQPVIYEKKVAYGTVRFLKRENTESVRD